MAAVFKLGLLLSLLASKEVAAADLTFYTPQLPLRPMAGRVTASTFVLEQPRCVFNSSSNYEVWVVVAYNTATITDVLLATKLPFSSFSNNQPYYHTYQNLESSYPCTNTVDPLTNIRIGDSSCTGSYCNSPLQMGTYKAIFVVLNNNILISKTGWSKPITLRSAKDPITIDTWPGGRSGGMIVITSVLSLLLAAFLAGLVGISIIASKKMSLGKTVRQEEPIPQAADIKNYKLHGIPESADIYAQPVSS